MNTQIIRKEKGLTVQQLADAAGLPKRTVEDILRRNKPFTTVFVDGNHENFDRLNSEFEVVDFHGGKAYKLNNSVYHLMRGEIFDFEGKKFLAFGGARSHDIDDGILSWEDFL